MKTKQNFTLGRGEARDVRFIVSGGAGATEVMWYCAEKPTTLVGDHDLDMTMPSDYIDLTDNGPDLFVDIHFVPSVTEALPVGSRHHELWVTIDGKPARRATGTVTVEDTLRS